MDIHVYNCRNLSAQEIITAIIEKYPWLKCEENRRLVYIGATKDIGDRLRRHRAGRVLFCGQTANQMVAAKVEDIAYKMGFYIGGVSWGGNGTNSYSIYVYAYLITSDTVQ